MSRNLYLDPNTNDLVVTDKFNLRLTVNIIEYVSQKIENTLKTFKNEWFLNEDIGLPFYTRILIKSANLNDVNTIFQTAILDIPEVESLISYVSSLDKTTRTFTVELEAQIAETEDTTGLLTILGIGG